jgi:hypothetical protein
MATKATGDASNIATRARMLDPFSRAWSVLAIACKNNANIIIVTMVNELAPHYCHSLIIPRCHRHVNTGLGLEGPSASLLSRPGPEGRDEPS